MDAESFRIAKVFSNGGDIHFRLPYFQRQYAWEKPNWQTLLNDILDLLQNPLQIAQQFRSKSHSDSGVNRTAIPEQIAHL